MGNNPTLSNLRKHFGSSDSPESEHCIIVQIETQQEREAWRDPQGDRKVRASTAMIPVRKEDLGAAMEVVGELEVLTLTSRQWCSACGICFDNWKVERTGTLDEILRDLPLALGSPNTFHENCYQLTSIIMWN